MSYTRVGPFIDNSLAVPLSAANLNLMDVGIKGASDRLDTLEGTSPTTSDLIVSRSLNTAAFSAASGGGSLRVLVAPFPLQIISVSLALSSALAQSADDVNYWNVDLRKGINSANTFATKTTKLTGGSGIAVDADWNFDAITFDPVKSVLAKGDLFKVYITTTGTPIASWPTSDITCRYQPL